MSPRTQNINDGRLCGVCRLSLHLALDDQWTVSPFGQPLPDPANNRIGRAVPQVTDYEMRRPRLCRCDSTYGCQHSACCQTQKISARINHHVSSHRLNLSWGRQLACDDVTSASQTHVADVSSRYPRHDRDCGTPSARRHCDGGGEFDW